MRLCVFSGGMDSFTLLHYVRGLSEHDADPVCAISFDYGQRHSKELDYAKAETMRLGIWHEVVDLRMLSPLLQGSALTSDIDVPEGHYTDATMSKTVVPGRNTLMISIAMAWAESQVMQGRAEYVRIYYGAHSGDHAIYPDCRNDYVMAMNRMVMLATSEKVSLCAPFIHMDKRSILQKGAHLGLTALDYGRSWTCYKGEVVACGVCGSCVERKEAFDFMAWCDPGENQNTAENRAKLSIQK